MSRWFAVLVVLAAVLPGCKKKSRSIPAPGGAGPAERNRPYELTDAEKQVLKAMETEIAQEQAIGMPTDLTARLHKAVLEGQQTIAAFLLDKGASLAAGDADGNTALHHAAKKGRTPMAEFLLARGAGVNARNHDGQTPLYKAAENGDKAMVRLLVAKGALVNVEDEQGFTPSAWARLSDQPEIAELLKTEFGAKK